LHRTGQGIGRQNRILATASYPNQVQIVPCRLPIRIYTVCQSLSIIAFRIKSRSGSGRVYKLVDKVMQIENDYEKEVFNGEVGRISGIDLEGQGVTSEDSQTRTVFLAERTLAIQEMIDYPPGWRDLNP